ncbi:dapper homolog 3 [Pygocentrus nattereri]|uniref:Dishevelled-binding antagonist of beta-catenin 3a n=1 Tax=Pygocentrus nattereri TaxID=42514 RepID=A0A3B4CS02_PYGNA|nr:dapper homolog 3 [Pygocentrus nattereri]
METERSGVESCAGSKNSSAMHRAFSFPAAGERSRYKERLEASLAGLLELEVLKERQEGLVLGALALGDSGRGRPAWGLLRHGFSLTSARAGEQSALAEQQQGLMTVLQQQVGELRVDTESSSVENPTEAADSGPSSGFYEPSDTQSPLDSGELSPRTTFPVRSLGANERPMSAGDTFVASRDGLQVSGGRSLLPRSLSAPQPPLAGIAERGVEREQWFWPVGDAVGEEDFQQAQRMETYILGLIQRRLLTARHCKPRTSLSPEARGVVRQGSLCCKEPPFATERHKASPSPERSPVWASYCLEEEQLGCLSHEEALPVHYPRPPALSGIRSTSLDFPCGALEPSSSEADSPQNYQVPHSPSSDEQLVNAQYIPAQPCRAPTRAKTHRAHSAPKASRPTHSPERVERAQPKPRAVPKKCRFTEERAATKKPGRRACRSQSENSLLGQKGAPERKYSTVERDNGRAGHSKSRRSQGGLGHRRWRSTLELSQDEAEPSPPPEQSTRRPRRSRPGPPPYSYSQAPQHLHHPHHFQHHPHLHSPDYLPCRPDGGYKHAGPAEWESSLSEGESPGSSSMSSDSDESGGLVWPQQLAPQLAPPSPPTPPGAPLQTKALVKIKASHALKKKILRFRTGSLKVMTTV